MKKLLLFFAISLIFVSRAFATDYVGDLVISIESAEAPATSPNTTIIIEETDEANSLYSLSIKDFSLEGMALGDINLKDVKGEKQDNGSVLLTTEAQDVAVMGGLLTAKVTLIGVMSSDGKSFKTEKLDILAMGEIKVIASFSGVAAGETALPSITTPSGADEVFDLAGKRVYSIDRRGIYIVRHADGTTSKVVKR